MSRGGVIRTPDITVCVSEFVIVWVLTYVVLCVSGVCVSLCVFVTKT